MLEGHEMVYWHWQSVWHQSQVLHWRRRTCHFWTQTRGLEPGSDDGVDVEEVLWLDKKLIFVAGKINNGGQALDPQCHRASAQRNSQALGMPLNIVNEAEDNLVFIRNVSLGMTPVVSHRMYIKLMMHMPICETYVLSMHPVESSVERLPK
eukprot:11730171-Ditylum_brightwellii.AAC.1